MNTVTLLKHDPSLIFPYSHIQDGRELFEKVEDRLNFAELLESVTQPIHPTEVFDMIVGTSTGALISFALVGGNYKNGKTNSKYVHTVKSRVLTRPVLYHVSFLSTPKMTIF
jgi:hypothetical protein